jgi:tetratricopeptide (TPR) repeat protein
MRAAMGKQQWQRAADLGNQWRQSGGREWPITLNLAISLCHTKYATLQELNALVSELREVSKNNEFAKLGLSKLLIQLARYEECIALLDQINFQNPTERQNWRQKHLKADALAKLGEFDHAIAALETQPSDSRDWRWQMARAGVELQRSEWSAAEKYYRLVLQMQPNHTNAHHNLALTLFSQQQWQEGWKEYEWRWSNPRRSTSGAPKPIPTSDILQNQTVIVTSEQGIGDQIMMMRFLPEVADRCRWLIVKVETRLIDLYKRSLPSNIHIIDKKDERDNQSDTNKIYIGSGSLPLFCSSRTLNDPTATPPVQLRPDPELVNHLSEKLQPVAKGRIVFGLGWLGGTTNEQQKERGLNEEDIQALVADEQRCWIDLQHLQPRWQHLRKSHGSLCHQLIENPGHDLDLTIALMATLDGVVTTRQTVAHLAGALELQGTILVPTRQEWRYSQDDGPWKWYPNLQCHNQIKRGDWNLNIQQLFC